MDYIDDSKSCQLRVRVTAEERDMLEKLRYERGRGETISDLVRFALSLLAKGGGAEGNGFSEQTHQRVEKLADLLKRETRQVEEACIEGILDLIDAKCEVPLIVMETHLHQKYRDKNGDFTSAQMPTVGSSNGNGTSPVK